MTNHPNRSRKVTVELTIKELELLNQGLHAGILDDAIECIGLTKREQKMLARVGNRLFALAGNKRQPYWE